ncbi:MAG: crotonase/enoyl-CoA hydratase family protein [Pseudomonadota bacterium]
MSLLTLTLENDIAHIHLDDGKANALSFDMLAAIHEALDTAEAEANAILLSGRAGRFCAGFDLTVMREGPEKANDLVNRGGHLLLRLFENKLPTVIACTGHALAAGGLMLLSADTRIGVQGDFKIGLNETAIGMVLPAFGIELPRARLAQDHFTAAVIQARAHSPDEAVAAGFLDQAVEENDLMETAMAAASALGQLPQKAYHGNKMLIRKPAIDVIRASLAPID